MEAHFGVLEDLDRRGGQGVQDRLGAPLVQVLLEQLGEDMHKRFWPEVVRQTLKCRQPDGSYWDYPLYGFHKFYGTGYALMTLARCARALR